MVSSIDLDIDGAHLHFTGCSEDCGFQIVCPVLSSVTHFSLSLTLSSSDRYGDACLMPESGDAPGHPNMTSVAIVSKETRLDKVKPPSHRKMTSSSPTHSDSSGSPKHDRNQVCAHSYVHVCVCASIHQCLCVCIAPALVSSTFISSLSLCIDLSLCTGQLGDCGRAEGGTSQHAGTRQTGRSPAEEEEVAYEGMAQGRPITFLLLTSPNLHAYLGSLFH